MKPDLRSQTLPELKAYLMALGEKPFRAAQLYQALWQTRARSWEQITVLSKSLRARMAEDFSFQSVTIATAQRSSDGSVKLGFRLHDGYLVEGVLIPTPGRITACVSSQVGCSLSCKFCATGYMPLSRNVAAYEIFDQVALISEMAQAEFGRPLTHIVYMGMGEPLLNYRNVLGSIERITAPDGLGMSPRRITLSTAGIAKMIQKLADDNFKCEFALSLHAANDAKRSEIMPINESNTLAALTEALDYFRQKTGTRPTYEYILFQDFNDSLKDAAELYAFWQKVPGKINIIEYNPIGEASYRFTSTERLRQFEGYLAARGVVVNVRRSRGKDVDGACGQLAIKQPVLEAV